MIKRATEMSFTDRIIGTFRYFSLKLLFNDIYEMEKMCDTRDDKYWDDDEKSRNIISHRSAAGAVYFWIISVIVVCFTGTLNCQTELTTHIIISAAHTSNLYSICRVNYYCLRICCDLSDSDRCTDWWRTANRTQTTFRLPKMTTSNTILWSLISIIWFIYNNICVLQ